jgi:hypothetical protein
MPKLITEWVPTRWRIKNDTTGRSVEIQERLSAKIPESRYVVFSGGEVLNSDGEWEWEPMPSSRTEEFIGRTRCPSFEAAAIRYDLYSERT